MILRHHLIFFLPNGESVNPGNLHDWLLAEGDGFRNGGNVNWTKVSAIARDAHAANPFMPNLEYNYTPFGMASISARLTKTEKEPMVLQVQTKFGTHFITAYDQTDPNTTHIADPYYADRTTLASYGNIATSMRLFTPSFTDLGIISVYTDPSVQLQLQQKINGSFVDIADAAQFVEDPIGNPESELPGGYGPTRILEHTKPTLGDYRVILTATNPGIFQTSIVANAKNGQGSYLSKDLIVTQKPTIIDISIPSPTQTQISLLFEFSQLRTFLQDALSSGSTKRGYPGSDLFALLLQSEKYYQSNRKLSTDFFARFLKLLESKESFFTKSTHQDLVTRARATQNALY